MSSLHDADPAGSSTPRVYTLGLAVLGIVLCLLGTTVVPGQQVVNEKGSQGSPSREDAPLEKGFQGAGVPLEKDSSSKQTTSGTGPKRYPPTPRPLDTLNGLPAIRRLILPSERLLEAMKLQGLVFRQMRRAEFETLVVQARAARQQQNMSPRLIEARYEARLVGDHLEGDARWKIRHPGRHSVILPLEKTLAALATDARPFNLAISQHPAPPFFEKTSHSALLTLFPPPSNLESSPRIGTSGPGSSGNFRTKVGVGQTADRATPRDARVLGRVDGDRKQKAPQQKRYSGILVPGHGEHTAVLKWSVHGHHRPEGTRFNLQLPRCPVASFKLEIPADRTLTVLGGSLVTGPLNGSKTDPVRKGYQRWMVVCGGRSQLNLLIRKAVVAQAHREDRTGPRPKGPREHSGQVLVNARALQQLTPEGLRATYEFGLEASGRGVTELVCQLSPHLRPYDVHIPFLDSSTLQPPTKPGDPALLVLRLRRPVHEATLRVCCLWVSRARDIMPRMTQGGKASREVIPVNLDGWRWESPALRIVDGVLQSETLEISIHPELRIETYHPGDFHLKRAELVPAQTFEAERKSQKEASRPKRLSLHSQRGKSRVASRMVGSVVEESGKSPGARWDLPLSLTTEPTVSPPAWTIQQRPTRMVEARTTRLSPVSPPWYRLTFVGGGYRSSAKVDGPVRPNLVLRVLDSEYRARQLLCWQLKADRMTLAAQIDYTIQRGRLFQLPIRLPKNWEVEEVHLQPKGALREWGIRTAIASIPSPSRRRARRQRVSVLVIDLNRPLQAEPSESSRPDSTGTAKAYSNTSDLPGHIGEWSRREFDLGTPMYVLQRSRTLVDSSSPRLSSRSGQLRVVLRLRPTGKLRGRVLRRKNLPIPDLVPVGARFHEGALAIHFDDQLYTCKTKGFVVHSGDALPLGEDSFKGVGTGARTEVSGQAEFLRSITGESIPEYYHLYTLQANPAVPLSLSQPWTEGKLELRQRTARLHAHCQTRVLVSAGQAVLESTLSLKALQGRVRSVDLFVAGATQGWQWHTHAAGANQKKAHVERRQDLELARDLCGLGAGNLLEALCLQGVCQRLQGTCWRMTLDQPLEVGMPWQLHAHQRLSRKPGVGSGQQGGRARSWDVPLPVVLGASSLTGEVTLHLAGTNLVRVEQRGLREVTSTRHFSTRERPGPNKLASKALPWRTFQYRQLPVALCLHGRLLSGRPNGGKVVRKGPRTSSSGAVGRSGPLPHNVPPLAPLPTGNAQIDRAHWTTIVQGDGTLEHRLTFLVRNWSASILPLSLPADANVLSVRVNGYRIHPHPNTSDRPRRDDEKALAARADPADQPQSEDNAQNDQRILLPVPSAGSSRGQDVWNHPGPGGEVLVTPPGEGKANSHHDPEERAGSALSVHHNSWTPGGLGSPKPPRFPSVEAGSLESKGSVHRFEVTYVTTVPSWWVWTRIQTPAPEWPLMPVMFRRTWLLADGITPLRDTGLRQLPGHSPLHRAEEGKSFSPSGVLSFTWPGLSPQHHGRQLSDLFRMLPQPDLPSDAEEVCRQQLRQALTSLRQQTPRGRTPNLGDVIAHLCKAFPHPTVVDRKALADAHAGPQTPWIGLLPSSGTGEPRGGSAPPHSPGQEQGEVIARLLPFPGARQGAPGLKILDRDWLLLITTRPALPGEELSSHPARPGPLGVALREASQNGQDSSGRFCSGLYWALVYRQTGDGNAFPTTDRSWRAEGGLSSPAPPRWDGSQPWSVWEPVVGREANSLVLVRQRHVTAGGLVLTTLMLLCFWCIWRWTAPFKLSDYRPASSRAGESLQGQQPSGQQVAHAGAAPSTPSGQSESATQTPEYQPPKQRAGRGFHWHFLMLWILLAGLGLFWLPASLQELVWWPLLTASLLAVWWFLGVLVRTPPSSLSSTAATGSAVGAVLASCVFLALAMQPTPLHGDPPSSPKGNAFEGGPPGESPGDVPGKKDAGSERSESLFDSPQKGGETVYILPGAEGNPEKQQVLVAPELLARLRAIRSAVVMEKTVTAPVLVSAHYEGRLLTGDTVEVNARFTIHHFHRESAELNIPLTGVALVGSALLDGERVLLTSLAPPETGYAVRIKGKGSHNLALRFRLPVGISHTERVIRFTGPSLVQNALRLALPSDATSVQAFGALGAQRTVPPSKGSDTQHLEVELGPQSGPVEVRWHQHHRKKAIPRKGAAAAEAKPSPPPRTSARVTFEEAYLWDLRSTGSSLTARLHYQVSRGYVSRLHVDVPGDLIVHRCRASARSTPAALDTDKGQLPREATLRDWHLRNHPDVPGQQLLRLDFSRPVSGELDVTLELLPRKPLLSPVPLPLPAPHGRQLPRGGFLAYRTRGLQAHPDQLFRVTGVKASAFAPFWQGPSRPETDSLAYACRLPPRPTGEGARPRPATKKGRPSGPTLRLRISSPPPIAGVQQEVSLHAKPARLEVQVNARITAASDGTSLVEWLVPSTPHFMVTNVEGPLVYRWHQNRQRVLVLLSRTAQQTTVKLTGWLVPRKSGSGKNRPRQGGWPPPNQLSVRPGQKLTEVALPTFRIPAAQETQTTVQLLADPGLAVQLARQRNLKAVVPQEADKALVWKSKTPNYNGTVHIYRAPASVARVLTLTSVEDNKVNFRTLIEYRPGKAVGQATPSTRGSVRIRLRQWGGENVVLDSPHAISWREHRRTPTDRSWVVELSPRVQGPVRLTLQGSMPVDEWLTGLPVPKVSVPGTTRKCRWLAIQGIRLTLQDSPGLKPILPSRTPPSNQRFPETALRLLLEIPKEEDLPRQLRLWDIQDLQWDPRLLAHADSTRSQQVRLVSMERTCALLRSGTVRGRSGEARVESMGSSGRSLTRSRWLHQANFWLSHSGAREYPLTFPDAVTVLSVLVDGVLVTPLQADPKHLWLSLPGSPGVRHIRVEWQYTQEESARPNLKPLLVGDDPEPSALKAKDRKTANSTKRGPFPPTLWTVQVPVGWTLTRNPQRQRDAQWLGKGARRLAAMELARATTQLEITRYLVTPKISNTNNQLETAQHRFARHCHRARLALGWVEQAEKLTKRLEELLNQNNTLANKHGFETIAQKAQHRVERESKTSQPASQDWASASFESYAGLHLPGTPCTWQFPSDSDNVVPSLHLHLESEDAQQNRQAVASSLWWLGLLVLVLMVSWSTSLGNRVRKRWPLLLLMVGAWGWFMAGSTLLVLVLLLVATLGLVVQLFRFLVRSVHQYFLTWLSSERTSSADNAT